MMKQHEAQQLFDEGAKLLSEAKFVEARDTFLQIYKSGRVSAGLEANLGRALVETGDLGGGISHLSRAVALDRWDDLNRSDLLLAQQKVESGWGVPMKHPAEWGQWWSTYLRSQENASIASFLLLILLATLFFKKLKRYAHYAIGAGVFIFASLAILSLYGNSLSFVVKDADLKSAPLESAEMLQTLKSGARLRVIRQSGDFSEVERSGAFRGWIKSSDLEKALF